MALTITQQLEIIKGNEKPPSNSVYDLVKQTAIYEGKVFIDNIPSFDAGTYPDAQKYVNKMTNAVRGIYNLNTKVVDSFVHLIVAIYGETGSFATVQAADDSGWETFIDNNIIEVLETYSGVTLTEKTEYESIIV